MRTVVRTDSNLGVGIDTSPLRDPVDKAAVRAFVRRNPTLFAWTRARALRLLRDATTVAFAVGALLVVLPIGAFFLLLVLAGAFQPDPSPALIAGWLLSPLVLVLVGLFARLVADAVRGSVGPRPRPERIFRLALFAARNGLTYRPVVHDPAHRGTLFLAGSRRTLRDVLHTDDRAFEIGNYTYAGGWMTERAYRSFGYVRIALPTELPHLVLEARANRRILGRSNLPWQFRRGQRLALEGDFQNAFQLIAPFGYERDALQLFTPDLMALLMDRARPFDVEIVGDALYLYSRRPFDLVAPVTYHRATAVAEAVWRPTAQHSLRWRDERTASGRIGTHGARLRMLPPIGAIIGGVYVAALVVRFVIVSL